MIHPLYSLAGVLVGMLVGLTGVGGGSLMTPLLVLVFGFHPTTAVGTDLLYASATKAVGTSVHGRRGTVDWLVVKRLAMGSVPTTIITLLVLGRVGEQSAKTGSTITTTLGVLLVMSAVATLFRKQLVGWLAPRFGTLDGRALAVTTVLLGAVLGILVSLTSVGAGALGMTALLILYPRVHIAKLVGSDIAHAVPLTLIAGVGHWLLGSVDAGLLISLLIGSIPGVIVGSMISSQINERVLAVALAAVLAIVGTRMLL